MLKRLDYNMQAEDLVAQLLCALNRAGDALPFCETAIKVQDCKS